ncbi:MAG: hypothetical protein JW958_00870 [Candidatus Eisenbacteria bacterium]|nr:hypothetical protein [Candidatus Eisenbacteria bacterium]
MTGRWGPKPDGGSGPEVPVLLRRETTRAGVAGPSSWRDDDYLETVRSLEAASFPVGLAWAP